jgi:hypothetical protein
MKDGMEFFLHRIFSFQVLEYRVVLMSYIEYRPVILSYTSGVVFVNVGPEVAIKSVIEQITFKQWFDIEAFLNKPDKALLEQVIEHKVILVNNDIFNDQV